MKKCIPIVLSFLEIFRVIWSRLKVEVFDAMIAVDGAVDSIL